ncbi:MAG TPA: hypothetical protein VFF28_02135 [Candidatus Nanoarchaeia archaeon]|nr:hypothetical protein [Candidatus Nanoarchaeia archaeon]
MERIRLEIKRQPIHMMLGFILIALIKYDLLSPIPFAIIILTAIGSSLYLKKKKPKRIYNLLRYVERPDALENFPGKGLITYLIGALIAIVLFEKSTAMAAIIILALGDSVSRLVGPFGRIKHPFNDARFLEGVIAGFIAGALGAMIFVSPSQAITASFVAMIIEGIDLKLFGIKVDDNIIIPSLAGAAVWLMGIIAL